MKNKHFILAIVTSVLLLLFGAIGYFFIHKHFEQYKVVKASAIVKIDKTTPDAQPKKKTLKTIIYDSEKAVVQIQVELVDSQVIGSGFLYNSKGDIITNAHVVQGAKTVTIKTSDAQTYVGKVIGIGDKTDVAVVRVDKMAGMTPLPIDTKGKADVGDEVIALGSPLGFQNTVTTGIISGTDRQFTIDPFSYDHVYQISAPITHGNSGGPLINKETGKVLAINSAGMDEGNIAFSIPISEVIDQVHSWSKSPQSIDGINGTGSSANDVEEGEALKSDAENLVNYFYESLNSHDYVAAYTLLGSDWQNKVSYDKFRKGYLPTLQASIEDLKSSLSSDGKKATVTIRLSALEQTDDGNKQTVNYSVTYTIGYENDQLRLFEGKGKVIKD
ncbi:S1-C subfamily serine protease [Pullulanibacillus pueri]|uniref:Peptidase S1 n=1 Tax=Pullulanibacillus pueri TaxID=1437324 RepID=A0A8J3EJY4_9BACL|nr:S1C family serine protease [Pullulanibacillus pueri]MBM7680001.1 S1-C subfamily serine protease [Pullulanibacillus pueri]GGH73874.1 peptidase S1 [Pullulanibacillus pueri]